MTNTIKLAAALIRVFEGLRTKAYKDAGGVWTIGYGHTQGVKEGDTCTPEQAEAWLAEDAAPLLALVAGRLPVEAAALVSFGYNCGAGALKRVLAGQTDLRRWVKAGGKVLPGLVSRRELEAALIEASRRTEMGD